MENKEKYYGIEFSIRGNYSVLLQADNQEEAIKMAIKNMRSMILEILNL